MIKPRASGRCSPYPAIAQMFLTPDALFVLVVDMFAYSAKHSREDALDQWLDILQSRVPGSIVLLVGTHGDMFGENSDEFSARKLSFNRGGSCPWSEDRCDEARSQKVLRAEG